MKDCKEIIKLIYLSDDELSQDEFSELSAHLQICPDCEAERREYFENEMRIINSIKSTPQFRDREILEESILEAVYELEQTDQRGDENKRTSPLFSSYVLSFRFRLAASLMLILITAALIFEQASGIAKIKQMEKTVGSRQAAVNIQGDVVFEKFSDFYNFLSGENEALKISSDLLLLKQSALSDYTQLAASLQNASYRENLNLLEQYPWLREIQFKDGISKKELQILIDNQSDLKNIINNFRGHYEN